MVVRAEIGVLGMGVVVAGGEGVAEVGAVAIGGGGEVAEGGGGLAEVAGNGPLPPRFVAKDRGGSGGRLGVCGRGGGGRRGGGSRGRGGGGLPPFPSIGSPTQFHTRQQ